MCGIVGILSNKPNHIESIQELLNTLLHRGPNGNEVFKEYHPFLALGHSRLSIIDLTSNGTQPKESSSGRFVITFNGEIYNHLRLRQKIEGNLNTKQIWQGNSDTETLLMCFEHFGIVETLKLINGMFAIAVWDRKLKEITLARDRFGEKPLYYSKFGEGDEGVFIFGSELRAIKKHKSYKGSLSSKALTHYLKYNYIPAPYSIYQNIFKLNSGSLMKIKYSDGSWKFNHLKDIEWSKPFKSEKKSSNKITTFDFNKSLDSLDDTLSEVVEDYMISDVPIGSFLSGGIDSTIISAIMQKVTNKPIKTFTIGSKDRLYDESKFAMKVAQHLGSDHHELMLEPQDVMDVIPDLCNVYDEPFADSSQIPTLLLAKFAKQNVSVSLSGDGGDEIFGGYNRYIWGPTIYKAINKTPKFLRASIGNSLNYLSKKEFQSGVERIASVLPKNLKVSLPSDKLRKIAKIIHSSNHAEMYNSLTQVSEAHNVLNSQVDCNIENLSWSHHNSAIVNMMFSDRKTYLTDDILVKTDRATMSVGLENRSPFLDYRLVNFADSLPDNFRVHGKQGKFILKELLKKYVPSSLIDRPKTGFSIPIEDWLRGPLKDWASELISKDNIELYGILNYEKVQSLWQSHLSGKQMHNELWGLLMLQNWLINQDQ
jgi:asparagine synthase (glutamine-hydrolysing)